MIEPRTPIYQWGEKVLTNTDLFNDGSYPDRDPDALLVTAESEGEIVQVGFHEEANIPVYLVEFANGDVVGCFEEELRPQKDRTPVAGRL